MRVGKVSHQVEVHLVKNQEKKIETNHWSMLLRILLNQKISLMMMSLNIYLKNLLPKYHHRHRFVLKRKLVIKIKTP